VFIGRIFLDVARGFPSEVPLDNFVDKNPAWSSGSVFSLVILAGACRVLHKIQRTISTLFYPGCLASSVKA
ncbi:conserved hypothetical protein, partial [Bordetella avium 197N]